MVEIGVLVDAGADHLCVRFGCRDIAGQVERFATDGLPEPRS